MDEKPYKFISSDKQFQGNHISVYEEVWRSSDGNLRTYDVVRSPNAVVIVALDEENKVLLVNQHRAGAGTHLLECPAGGIDFGESAIECAKRELREETGFSSENLAEIGSFWTIPGFASEKMFIFMAMDLFYDPLKPDDDEDLELFRVSFDEAIERAKQGQLADAKTIAALFLAEEHIRRNTSSS